MRNTAFRSPALALVLPVLLAGSIWRANDGSPVSAPMSPGPSLEVITSSLPPGAEGRPYEARLVARGGHGEGRIWHVVSGCLPPGLRLEAAPPGRAWTAFEAIGKVEPGDGDGGLGEISGLAASLRNPGILWAHDDSGTTAEIYALAPDGRLRQRYRLDTTIRDWEDLALGPGRRRGRDVLYIADIGDNLGVRETVQLLRVREPAVPERTRAPIALRHETFFFRYPDGPRDAEALLVDWESGIPYIVDKHDDGGAVYRVPVPLGRAADIRRPATLVRVTQARPLPRLITAADAGRDGGRIVLRHYLGGWEILRPAGDPFESIFTAELHRIRMPSLGQYEALALGPRGARLYTTSERLITELPLPLLRATAYDGAEAGRLCGTPSERGSYTVAFEVRDASDGQATRSFEIVIH